MNSIASDKATVTDSIILQNIRSANFTAALQGIELAKRQNIKGSAGFVILLLRSCEAYINLGNYKAAEEAIIGAKLEISNLKNPGAELYFQYFLQKGMYLSRLDENVKAIYWLKQAELKLQALVQLEPYYHAQLFSELGKCSRRINDISTAVKYFNLALKAQAGKSSLDIIEKVKYSVWLAEAEWDIGENQKATDILDSCLAFLDAFPEPLHPALIETYFSVVDYCLNYKSNTIAAERYLRNATLVLKNTYPADHFLQSMLLYYKGELEYYTGDYNNSIIYINRSLINAENHPFLSQYRNYSYYLLACINFVYALDYNKAIKYCNLILAITQNKDRNNAYLYYLMGRSYEYLKNYPLAEKNFNEVFQANSGINSPNSLDLSSKTLIELSRISQRRQDLKQADTYLKRALRNTLQISNKGNLLMTVFKERGRLEYLKGNYGEALNMIQNAIIASCREFSDSSVLVNPPVGDIIISNDMIECFSLKAYYLYSLFEKYPENESLISCAYLSQKIAVKLAERIVINIDDEIAGLSQVNAKKLALNNAVSYATILYLKTGVKSYALEAFEYSEKSKMLVLQLYTRDQQNLVNSGVPDSLIGKENLLNREITIMENRFAIAENNGRTGFSNNQELEKLTRLYDLRDALANRLEEDYPDYYKAKYEFHVASLQEVQEMLQEDQVILEYQLLKTEIITFVIAKHDFSIHYQLIDNKTYDEINSLRNAVTSDPLLAKQDNAFEQFCSASNGLYNKLILPVYDKIRNKRLIIIPHNELTMIPFEVLISEMPRGDQQQQYRSLDYLIRDFPVIYAYSANLLLGGNTGNFGKGTGIFLPDYATYRSDTTVPFLPVLGGALKEASNIKKLSHGRLFKKTHAVEHNFKSRAGRFRVLHIASHALLNEKNPSLSSLVMTASDDTSEDGKLYSFEISQLKLKAQLVVLSGCNTGYGVLRGGEGLISLTRSFFYTGVRTVAYTLWTMADEAGASLITSFYKGLKRHKSLDDAMRDSKLAFLKSADPLQAHPYYWAGYVIVGKSDPVQPVRPGFWILVSASALSIALMIYLAIRKFS